MRFHVSNLVEEDAGFGMPEYMPRLCSPDDKRVRMRGLYSDEGIQDTKSTSFMNAIQLLKADHETVEDLFGNVEATERPDHARIFVEIKAELETHAHVEETIFYPALQEEGSDELVELVSDALKEHQQAKAFLGELSVAAEDSDRFEGLLTKLIEDVRHHAQDEEDKMFPLVDSEFAEEAIDELGAQMAAEKDRFNSSAESAHA